MADKPSSSPAMAFILDFLKTNGDTEYAKVKEAAEAEGHAIYPIMYGRAKTLLNMIPEDRPRRRRARRPAEGEDASRRTLRQGATPAGPGTTANQLSDFLERFKELEEERNRYRAALLGVEKLLREALQED